MSSGPAGKTTLNHQNNLQIRSPVHPIFPSVVGHDNARYVEALKRIYPEEKFGTFEFEGGFSCFSGTSSPFSDTLGFGLKNIEENKIILEQIEDFYRHYSYPPTLSIPSVCDESTYSLLLEKDYRLKLSVNVYVRAVSNFKPYVGEISVQRCQSKEQINTWIQVLPEGFNGNFDAPDIISLGQSQKDGNIFFLAFDKQKVIAGASLYVADKIARLGGMVTLKEHRLQGAQTALITYRMAVTAEMGCISATSETEPGNRSQKNLEKAGFKLAYVRNVFRKNS